MDARKEGVCLPIYGYEEDFLTFVEGSVSLVGITRLIREAGGLPTEWAVEHAFENEGSEWDDEGKAEIRAEYRLETGRTYPPLYRVTITTELEEMPAQYVAEYWAGKRAQSAAIPRSDLKDS